MSSPLSTPLSAQGIVTDATIHANLDSAALTRQLVHDGVGYSITAQLAVRDFMKAGRLVARPIERPSLRSSVAIATLHNVRSSRLAQTWNELMVEELRKLVLHGAWSDAADWLGN